MKVIFAGAGAFVLLALLAFWQALQLIPTDLGNSYLVAASVLLSAAGMLGGLGVVGQKILNEITVVDVQSMLSGERLPATIAPASLPSAPEPVVPSRNAPTAPVLAGAAAGAAAGMALGGATAATPEIPSDAKLLDELERDLFAEIKTPTLTLTPVLDEPVPPLSTPFAPDISLGEPEDAALLQPTGAVASDTGEDDDLVLPPLPPIPSFERPEPAEPEPAPFATDEERRAIEDAAHDDEDIDDKPEETPPEAPPASPTPGLIHDEDLARLSDAEADLAPLETLEVVGAYDSGGTRFTMYSDGSVTAKGEGVDRRFRSLDDLRAFIDGGMKD